MWGSAADGLVECVHLQSPDSAARAEGEKRERALLYVALTRAKRDVLITSHGAASPWLVGGQS